MHRKKPEQKNKTKKNGHLKYWAFFSVFPYLYECESADDRALRLPEVNVMKNELVDENSSWMLLEFLSCHPFHKGKILAW